MRETVFFDLNRINYRGGAEKYVREVGSWLVAAGRPVRYVGDFRLILKAFTWLGFLFGTIGFGECRKLLQELDGYPRTDPAADFPIEPLSLASLVPFSKARKRIKASIADSQAAFVKNELPDLLLFRLFARSARKKYCLVFTSIAYPEKGTLRSFAHNLFYLSPLYGWLLGGFDGIVVSNRRDAETAIGRFGVAESRIIHQPYGLDAAEFSGMRATKAPGSPRDILFVGRLEEQKGVSDILAIAERHSEAGKDPRFTLIGDGPLRKEVEAAAGRLGNVAYRGALPNREVRKAYLAADVVAVPSRWETFCYVALEAQLSGCPVVAYGIPGPDGIVIDGKSGRLVPPFDRDAFAEALEGDYEVDRAAFVRRFSKESVVAAYGKMLE